MLRIVAMASLLATAATMQLSASNFRRVQASTDPTIEGISTDDIDDIVKDAVDGMLLTTVDEDMLTTVVVKDPQHNYVDEIIEEYPELGAPLPAEDMLSGPEETDGNATCEVIHGKYVNFPGHEVTVYQDGCSIKAAFWLNKVTGGVIESGQIVGDKIHLRQFGAEGTIGDEGTIFFGGGMWWKREDQMAKPSDNLSVNSSVNSSDVTGPFENSSVNPSDVAGSSVNSSDVPVNGSNASATLAADACKDISGHYKSKAGKLVTVQQTGCDLSVLTKLSDVREVEVLSGTIDDIFVNVKVLGMGAVHGSAVDFAYGTGWKKLDDTALESIEKDNCADVSGSYLVHTGKLVSVKQVGCHAVVTTIDGDTKESMTKLGSVVGDDLKLFDFSVSRPGHRDSKEALDFGNGVRWGKLTSAAAASVTQDNCSNLAGNYRDANSDISMVSQAGCHIKVQHFLNSEEGDITVAGYVFGDIIHVKGFSMGKANAASGQVHWAEFKDKDWTRLSAEESTELGIPEGGCTKFGGLYLDMDRKPVVVKQTDCKLKVTFWLGTLEANVTRGGYVSANTVHIQNFIHNGFLINGNIMFGNVSAWEHVDDLAASANTTVSTMEQCGDFHGLYLDQLGNSVLVSQTGCDLKVTFWAESLNTNLTKSGHVEGQSMHIQDFQAYGERTDAGMKFGEALWFLADDGNLLFSNITQEDNASAVALLQTGKMVQKYEAVGSHITA